MVRPLRRFSGAVFYFVLENTCWCIYGSVNHCEEIISASRMAYLRFVAHCFMP